MPIMPSTNENHRIQTLNIDSQSNIEFPNKFELETKTKSIFLEKSQEIYLFQESLNNEKLSLDSLYYENSDTLPAAKSENVLASKTDVQFKPASDTQLPKSNSVKDNSDSIDKFATEKFNNKTNSIQKIDDNQLLNSFGGYEIIDEEGNRTPISNITQEQKDQLIKENKLVFIINGKPVFSETQLARFVPKTKDPKTGESRPMRPDEMLVLNGDDFKKLHERLNRQLFNSTNTKKTEDKKESTLPKEKYKANQSQAPPSKENIKHDRELDQPASIPTEAPFSLRTIKQILIDSLETAKAKEREEKIQKQAEAIQDEINREEIQGEITKLEVLHSFTNLSEIKSKQLTEESQSEGTGTQVETFTDETDGIEFQRKNHKNSQLSITPKLTNSNILANRCQHINSQHSDIAAYIAKTDSISRSQVF